MKFLKNILNLLGYIFGQLITSNLDVSLELGSMLAANAIKQIGASPTNDVANEIFKKYPQFVLLSWL